MSKLAAELIENIKVLNLKVREIANSTGINEQRMYKWFQGIGYPKAEDCKILEGFYKDYIQKLDRQQRVLKNTPAAPDERETIKELKADKAYLQKMNDSLLDQLNLNSTVALKMLATQLDLTRNGHLLQIMIAANGDAKKEIELMKKMGKLSDVAQRKDAKNSK